MVKYYRGAWQALTSNIVPRNICTLVGPVDHFENFDRAGYELGKRGWLVFSVGSHRKNDAELKTTEFDRKIYFQTHRQKIRISSLVYVVDCKNDFSGTHVGADSRDEIYFAEEQGIDVMYMSATWKDKLPYARGYEKEYMDKLRKQMGEIHG